MPDANYEPARAVAAEGARVGFAVCRHCGATVLLDEAVPFDALSRHTEWHDLLEALRG